MSQGQWWGAGGLGAELSAVLSGLHVCLLCLPANPEDMFSVLLGLLFGYFKIIAGF